PPARGADRPWPRPRACSPSSAPAQPAVGSWGYPPAPAAGAAARPTAARARRQGPLAFPDGPPRLPRSSLASHTCYRCAHLAEHLHECHEPLLIALSGVVCPTPVLLPDNLGRAQAEGCPRSHRGRRSCATGEQHLRPASVQGRPVDEVDAGEAAVAAGRDASVRRKYLLVIAVAAVAAGLVVWALWPAGAPPRARPYLAFTACLLTDGQGIGGAAARPVWAGMSDASLATRVKVQYLPSVGAATV